MNKIFFKLLRRTYLAKFVFNLFSFSGLGLTRYSFFRSFLELLTPQLRLEYVEIFGNKIFLDSKDSLSLSLNNIYEPEETELVKKEVQEGNIVFDIGANIGYYTLLFAKLVGKKGKVFAFEPDPDNFALLKKNVETNGYQNVVLIQKAVTNKNDKIKLYLCNYNYGMHRTYESTFCEKFLEIESVRLDDYLKSINFNDKVDLVKIDIEGTEYETMHSMNELLEKNENLKILIEFAPFSISECGYEPEDLLDNLLKKRFKISKVELNKDFFLPTSKNELLQKYTVKKKNYVSLWCIR